MSASQRSSRTTTGSVMPSRLAVATSPHVIWKQPSPNRHTTGASGRASLAAIAPGRPKPMDDQPLVIWRELANKSEHSLTQILPKSPSRRCFLLRHCHMLLHVITRQNTSFVYLVCTLEDHTSDQP